MKILLLAASLREDSCNKKLITLSSKLSGDQKIKTKTLDFADFQTSLYNGDIEEKTGIPETAQNFVTQLKDADGLILSSPEYNFSTPGTLKNLIDWVSRAKPMPWLKYPILLLSASPSTVGGNRGLLHTATVLQSCCNANVFSGMFCLADAYNAFSSDGSLKDDKLQNKLAKDILEFNYFINALKQ